jgi:VIT1/CCC1 family predicted Fe2+/Mn2+ transporter
MSAATTRSAPRRALDPADRASELLFGLIMVLTFTLSLGVAGAGDADVRAVLIGALGCNLAWGVIDAVMYLMGVRAERGLGAAAARAARAAATPEEAHALILEQLPEAVRPALGPAELERIRVHIAALPEARLEPRLERSDYLAAIGVFLLVFLCLFPVAAPFLFVADVPTALRISNVIAVGLLFAAGFAFGRHVGRPWRVGFAMVGIGLAMVAVAVALGG